MSGTSFLGFFGLECTLPLNLDFIGLDFTEILLGYKKNLMTYQSYMAGDTTLSSSLKVISIQYLFGIGLVF